jgi:hypothetical protein
MFLELECPHCGLKVNDISGKPPLEYLKKVDTIVMGKPFTIRCFCGRDMHIIGVKADKSYTYKNDINRVAEI